jgi:hypothetical protein
VDRRDFAFPDTGGDQAPFWLQSAILPSTGVIVAESSNRTAVIAASATLGAAVVAGIFGVVIARINSQPSQKQQTTTHSSKPNESNVNTSPAKSQEQSSLPQQQAGIGRRSMVNGAAIPKARFKNFLPNDHSPRIFYFDCVNGPNSDVMIETNFSTQCNWLVGPEVTKECSCSYYLRDGDRVLLQGPQDEPRIRAGFADNLGLSDNPKTLTVTCGAYVSAVTSPFSSPSH